MRARLWAVFGVLLAGCGSKADGGPATDSGYDNDAPPQGCELPYDAAKGWNQAAVAVLLREDSNFSCQGVPAAETFYVDAASFSSPELQVFESGHPVSLDVAEALELVDAAMWRWNEVPGLELEYSYVDLAVDPAADADVSNIRVVENADVAADTIATYDVDPPDAASNNVDIVIYTHMVDYLGEVVPVPWTPTNDSGQFSLTSQLTTQLGHALGIDHNFADEGSVMHPALEYGNYRSILGHDEDAAKFIYP